MFDYEGVLYRPPSEGNSLIVQATIGCAHNTCTFCNMYKDKSFRVRNTEEVLDEIREFAASKYAPYFTKFFIADGDALVLPTKTLLTIMGEVKRLLPRITRTTVYGTTQDILRKSDDELSELKNAGLEMVYLGAESGDDDILKAIGKDVTAAELIEAGKKLKKAGIKNSVTLISGMGGRANVKKHALSCAKLINGMNPEYCSFLTLRVFEGTPLYEDVKSGAFELITADEIMDEMEIFLSEVDSPGTIFRSNHASNYLPLAGTFNEDIATMLDTVRFAKENGMYRKFRQSGEYL